MADNKRDQTAVNNLLDELYSLTRNKDGSSLSVPQLDDIDNRLQLALASLRGHRNSLLPIHRLPPELLTEIFYLTQSRPHDFCPWFEYDELDRERKKLNHVLLQVCRHWRGIVATSPTLWSIIDSLHNPDTVLKRSGAAPLKVFISDGEAVSPAFLESLSPCTQRFAEYHFWGGGGSKALQVMKSGAAPLLHSLTILNAGGDNPYMSSPAVLPPIFDGKMPRLKKLALTYYTSWPDGYFTGLTHVYLCTQSDLSRPSTSEFLDFLEQSPLLEELSLDIAGPTRDNTSDIPPTPATRVVELKHLRELNIGGWPIVTLLSRFLSHIGLPPTANMYIWGMCLVNIDDDLGLVLPPDISRLRNLTRIRRFMISRSPSLHPRNPPFLSVEGETLHVCGSLSPSHIVPMSLRYPLEKVRRFTIRDGYSHPVDRIPTSVWVDFFRNMPSVRSLHIIRSPSLTGITRSVISALLPPPQPDSSSQQGSTTPRCPNLRTLTIEGDPKLPSLLLGALAQDRSSKGIPLKKLEIIRARFSVSPPASDESDDDKDGVLTSEDIYLLKQHIRDVVFKRPNEQIQPAIPPGLGGRVFKWICRLYAGMPPPLA